MTASLKSARLKYSWALDSFRALQEQVRIFMAGKPYGLRPEEHVGEGWLRVRFHVRRNPPMEWARRAADTLGYANAALDHLVYGLSRTKQGGTGFPVFIDPDTYVRKNREGLLAGVRAYPDRAIIDAYQPYEGLMEADPLWRLREFVNRDKHRISEPGFARARNARVYVPPGYSFEVKQAEVAHKVPNGAHLFDFRVSGPPAAEGGVQVKAEIDITIGFGYFAVDLVEIEEILARVDEIIRAF